MSVETSFRGRTQREKKELRKKRKQKFRQTARLRRRLSDETIELHSDDNAILEPFFKDSQSQQNKYADKSDLKSFFP